MNARGLKIYEGLVITCAETDEIWSVERFGDPEDAHAEIGPDGKVVFVPHNPEKPEGTQLLH